MAALLVQRILMRIFGRVMISYLRDVLYNRTCGLIENILTDVDIVLFDVK